MFDVDKLIKLLQEYSDNNNGGGRDTVYMITPNGNIRNLTILSIDIKLEKEEIKMTCLAVYEFEGNPCYMQIQSFQFGKTVFLTKEQAEAKLKELKQNAV